MIGFGPIFKNQVFIRWRFQILRIFSDYFQFDVCVWYKNISRQILKL